MISIKPSKSRLVNAIFGCFFAILGLILPFFASTANVYADVDDVTRPTVVTTENNTDENKDENASTDSTDNTSTTEKEKKITQTCDNSLGSLGWLVCPATGKISEAVDWLYDKNKEVLEINPVKAEEESPIYQIWNYFLGVANIAFVIFLLIAIYSQITGVGISNYGIKKALPKLIIAAIMVNLSFLICSILVDASNIIGAGLRGIFTSIEESTVPYFLGAEGAASAETNVAMTELYGALAGGTGLAVTAGFVAFEGGEIWMLIPAVLAALISVVVGLITIALRQVVVILLIMIAPLAIVAYIMPNTESLFKKWKNLLVRMLVFYPMYSLLFGASSLAGWAIIASAQDGFGLILGTAAKIFPLFFSWSLMKMSGTFLGTVNAKITGFFARPLAANRSWAESHRELTRQKNLASNNAYTPSLRLRQYLSDRKIMREEETKEHAETVKLRGQTYAADKNYRTIKGGKKVLSREGEESHAEMTRRIAYQRKILEHKNNFNDSVAEYARDEAQRRRLEELDANVVRESDRLKMETARGELIEYRNAVGFHDRMEDAMNAHFDETVGYKLDKNGNRVPRPDYAFHFDDADKAKIAMDRYNDALKIMHGNHYDAQYAAAVAAHSRDSQQKIHDNRLQKYAELLPPTRDVEYRLKELIDAADKATDNDTVKNIDAIISFMRVLNQRGDTDLVSKGLYNVLSHGVEVGTHASQALAGFSMFEVKDADPFLRRFGKYINLETAQVFNKNKRKNKIITLDEFVTGQYEEDDPNNPGKKITRYSKRPLSVLMEGTSLDGVERTAYGDGEMIMMHPYWYDDENDLDNEGKPIKKLNVKKYLAKRGQVDLAMEPQFISASLKYLSGSEQLKSAVKYKTGYYSEMMVDEDGNPYVDENGDPLYESVAIWDKKDRKDNPYIDDIADTKEYFRSHTMDYLWNQTPNQILQLRSDYYDGIREHLADTFLKNNDEDLTADEKQAKEEYLAEVARINEVYGENPEGMTKVARNKEMVKARHKIAGKEMIKWLDRRGTLEQIYRSRRSGAANAAKPWVRDWLGLDNEVMIRAYEQKKRAEQQAEKKRIDNMLRRQNGESVDVDVEETQQTESRTSQKEDEEIEKIAKALARILNRSKDKENELHRDKKKDEDDEENDGVNVNHDDAPRSNVYSESDQEEYINYIEDLYYSDDNKHSPDDFFEQAYDYLKTKLSPDSYVVVSLKKMYEEDSAADSHTIKSWILELLDDLDNY